ncbi:RusA family crossover junction endodeoxyribonuclease [Glutamicibacter sp. ZJUTW]|uniref:RusA family crossover junction endodeoxyribonuclease n=1 Tax=Glutamicibacter sp. ZJUTW TaxID=1155384 RepID=UPI0011F206ED|nr:RusA family crossover junction endodeoxyribonuclease [Glutamicibacter sp. ZJUTW]QEP06167.1 RusA family crossover junction endodeoxyribonuclease [Glutamicibacter sp. ZJUTW]
MISFFVPGTPAGQGSKTFYGKGRMAESSKKLKPWRDEVTRVAKLHALDAPIDLPVRVYATFWIERPGRPKFADYPATPFDLDKLCRGVGDALQQSGLLKDDSRIVTWVAKKRWALDTPGASISIEPVTPAD